VRPMPMQHRPSEVELRRGEEAAWGPKSASSPDRPRMRLLEFKAVTKGSLHGFVTIELPIGLQIADIPILAGRNGLWANMPAKPQMNQDGSLRRDASGKPAYVAILKWRDRALSDRFSAAVIALIHEQHPAALDGGGAP
jgi:hypothetical protein